MKARFSNRVGEFDVKLLPDENMLRMHFSCEEPIAVTIGELISVENEKYTTSWEIEDANFVDGKLMLSGILLSRKNKVE